MKIIRIIVIVLIIIGAGIVAFLAFNPDIAPAYTGFGAYTEKNGEHRSKTLWDWLDLLIIPVAIGMIAWSFKESEKEKASKIEEDRFQNETLDSFIKIMTELITKNELAGIIAKEETKIIARTRINLALSNLNGSRKGQVLQFLFESGLIEKNPKVSIVGSNFKNAILDGIVLRGVELSGVYFNNASLIDSNLSNANFIGCNFSNSNLSNSIVENTDFSYANFTNAFMTNMDLTSVNFEGTDLTNTDLRKSKIKQEQLDSIIKKKGIKLTKSKIL